MCEAYSIEKKLEVVDYAKRYPNNSTVKKINVLRGSVQQWVV
jgi:hypothetical protein